MDWAVPKQAPRPLKVRTSYGVLVTKGEMPARGQRWTWRRKEMLALGIAHGIIDRATTLEHYSLTEEEIDDWVSSALSQTLGRLKLAGRNARRGNRPSGFVEESFPLPGGPTIRIAQEAGELHLMVKGVSILRIHTDAARGSHTLTVHGTDGLLGFKSYDIAVMLENIRLELEDR